MDIIAAIHDGIETLRISLFEPRQLTAVIAAVIAGALIVVSTLVRTILPLRWLAAGANLGFVAYGLLQPAPLVLLLHAVLLPINLVRGVQMMRLVRRVREAGEGRPDSAAWLTPYMRVKQRRAGTVIFRKGETADHLYFLAEGEIELVELGHTLKAGRMFGEIAFFAPDRRRTSTARCLTDCKVLRIDEATLRQLYFQNPEFGFHVVGLIAARLSEDVRRLEAQIAKPAYPGNPVASKR